MNAIVDSKEILSVHGTDGRRLDLGREVRGRRPSRDLLLKLGQE